MVTDYRAFHLTVIGASHIKNGTVCQDCSQSCEKTECRLVVVCDGHGGADYIRADRGSKLAAATFTDCMENPDLIAALSAAATEKQRKSRIEQLIKSIIARWNSLVEQDMRQHPFDEDELSGVSEKARRRYEAGERLQAAYGTTLIGAVLAENFWLGLQIGDGKCVAVSETGEFTQPIPWDEECFLNVTFPAGVFSGSDGMDDCFAGDERLYDFYRVTLKSFAETDEETAIAQLKEYLPTLSEKGSGDDMSVGILVNTDLVCKSESVYRK